VTFTDNGDGTASLAGTPGAGTGGTYPITFTAGNGILPNATQSFTLMVNQGAVLYQRQQRHLYGWQRRVLYGHHQWRPKRCQHGHQ